MRIAQLGSILILMLGTQLTFAGLEVDGGGDKKENGPKIDVPDPAGGAARPTNLQKKGPLSEVLRFKDGDTLHGNLVSINDKGLTWTRPDINAPIITKLTHLRGVKLFRQPAAEPTGSRVQLTNDDVLFGKLVGMNAEELTIQTWFAGKLVIPKVMVRSITPGSKGGGALLFSGPGKLSDWGYKRGSWKLKSGKFECYSGQIGRDLKLPNKVHIRMDVSWTGSYPSFSIISHTNDIKRYHNDCYNLQFSSYYVYLYRGSGNQNFGNLNYRQLRQMKKVKIDLYVDKDDKKVALMLNGNLVKQWAGLNYAPSGNGFMLISHGGYGPTTFSNIRIMRWDGKVPSSGGTTKVEKQDLVYFTNGDKMTGQVKEINYGKVVLKPGFADAIPVPITNVAQITFGDEEAERARRNAGDCQLYFHNGDRLTLKLLDLKDGKINGKSENFGTKDFELSAFIGVRFNVYDEDAEDSNEKFEELLLQD